MHGAGDSNEGGLENNENDLTMIFLKTKIGSSSGLLQHCWSWKAGCYVILTYRPRVGAAQRGCAEYRGGLTFLRTTQATKY